MPSTWPDHKLMRLQVRMCAAGALSSGSLPPGQAASAESVRLELWSGDVQQGQWDVPAADLKVPRSRREVQLLRARLDSPKMQRARQVVGQILPALRKAHGHWVSDDVLDRTRRHIQSDESLPRPVELALEQALKKQDWLARPLWVEFGAPTGFLPFVNWERLLRPIVAGPVLRLPYHSVNPISSTQALDILISCSGADEGVLLSENEAHALVHAIIAGVMPQSCTVHVFTDAAHYPLFAGLQSDPASSGSKVRVYEPPPALELKSSADREAGWWLDDRRMQDHPWSSWIERALGGRAIDICHLVARGELMGGDAALQIAEAPSPVIGPQGPRIASLFVTAPYLSGLLDMVGASTAVLSSVGSYVSRVSIRVLCDQIARSRPLTVVGHDLSREMTGPNGRALCLESVYAFLRTPTPVVPPSDRDLIIYCHPSQVLGEVPAIPPGQADPLAEVLAEARTLAQGFLDRTDNAPAWLAAAHRVVERTMAEYLSLGPDAQMDPEAREGTRAALELLTSVLADGERVTQAVENTGPTEETR